MHSQRQNLLNFIIDNSNSEFVIPIYQRHYNWIDKIHCKRLLDDLVELVNRRKRRRNRSHFLGSIVCSRHYNDEGDVNELLLIDGQQRVLTISILLLAICNLLSGGIIKSTKINTKQIMDLFLLKQYSNKDKKKIRLDFADDKNAFNCLFDEKLKNIQGSNITKNYNYFIQKIKNLKTKIDDLFDAIKNLDVIVLELEKERDDAQLVFESLNSTGLNLSEGEKVKNFILMNEDKLAKQKNLYIDYWLNVEKNTKIGTKNNIEVFIYDFIKMKTYSYVNKRDVYLCFRNYLIDGCISNEKALAELLKYSIHYRKLALASEGKEKYCVELNKINILRKIVFYPFLMEILNFHHDEKIIDENDLIKIFKLIVSFVFRRIICDFDNKGLNRWILELQNKISAFANYKQTYYRIFKFKILELTIKRNLLHFPRDSEFMEKIIIQDVYTPHYSKFLLEQLECFKTNEKVVLKNLKIEQIMPSKLSTQWQETLGPNWANIHYKYLNTLGNLTLIKLDTRLGNKSFYQKLNAPVLNLRTSRLWLNKWINLQNTWNQDTITQRAQFLANEALKIWKFPTSDYSISDNYEETFNLDYKNPNFNDGIEIKFKIKKNQFVVAPITNNLIPFFRKFLHELSKYNQNKLKKVLIEFSERFFTINVNDKLKINRLLFDIPVLNNVFSNKNISEQLCFLVNSMGISNEEVQLKIKYQRLEKK